MKPAISIVIPTFNRPKLLQRAARSALIACPEDGEVIVVDDRSNTAEKALAALAPDGRLKVIANAGDKGAAGARNTGVGAARSDVILFLDDDDALVANYPNRVLAAASDPDAAFGFSTMTVDTGGAVKDTHRGKLKPGLLARDVSLENKTAGLGAGFWTRRAIFLEVGGIKTDQINDEDTDLCCRLYGHGHSAWFEAEPGCIIYQDYATGDDTAPQLTRSTPPKEMAACYMRTFERNEGYFGHTSGDRWFLLRRALRAAAKTGADDVGRELLHGLRPVSWRIIGWLFWQMKRAGARLR